MTTEFALGIARSIILVDVEKNTVKEKVSLISWIKHKLLKGDAAVINKEK